MLYGGCVSGIEYVKGTETVYKVGKFLSRVPGLRRLPVSWRDRVLVSPIGFCHERFAHQLRSFAEFCSTSESVLNLAAEDNLGNVECTRFCDEASIVMEVMRGSHHSQEVHCCLKLLVQDEDPTAPPRVAVVARSDRGLRGRPKNLGFTYANPVTANTPFASILGRNDGKTDWKAPFPCFCCNDLKKVQHRFQCGRENFWHYYCSTVAYPIRFHPKTNDEPTTIGFLTFDTQESGGFPGLTCNFDYYNGDEYHSARFYSQCKKSPVWSAGAMRQIVLLLV